MKICVLQPSYEGSESDYRHYDPPRDLSGLLPRHEFHHEFIKKISSFRQIRELRKKKFDVYVNLCEGYLDSDVPSLDVILALEHFDLPYTGPCPRLYDPSKEVMKLAARAAGVEAPAHVLAGTLGEAEAAAGQLGFPLFVKPGAMGDSIGIDEDSLVRDLAGLRKKAGELIEAYGEALVERYIDGREFTVLVSASPEPGAAPLALLPVEFVFKEGAPFKTYDLKVRQFHPEANVPCREPELAEKLKAAARLVFGSFSGEGYARMDFRVSGGAVYFLEANFACSVLYPEGHQGSADYILQHDGLGQAGFLARIIAEARARHKRRRKVYAVRPSPMGGYGLFALRRIERGEVVFEGEGRSQRIISRSFVEKNWGEAEKADFYRYAYPVGEDVHVLWEKDPAGWAPQNHSCDPNTGFAGLNVVALKEIGPGEELTLDYGSFCGPSMTPFDCVCKSPKCRGRISPSHGSRVSPRVRSEP